MRNVLAPSEVNINWRSMVGDAASQNMSSWNTLHMGPAMSVMKINVGTPSSGII